MSQTNINNRVRIRNIISRLKKLYKKPTIDHELTEIIDEYQSIANSGVINFAETGIIIEDIANIYAKRVDLLSKESFAYSLHLCNTLRRPEEEINEPSTSQDNVELLQPRVVLTQLPETIQQQASQNNAPNPVQNIETPKEKGKSKRAKKSKTEEVGESSKKISIPGLPDEILESLNLTDCNIDDVVRECMSKLTASHPLYSVFAKIGDEISRTKNLITYNDISLSGKSWNILYILENLLNKHMPANSETQNDTENKELEPSQSSANIDSVLNTENEPSQNSANLDSVVNKENEPSQSSTNFDSVMSSESHNTLTCTQISENGVENITEMYEDTNNEETIANSGTQQESGISEPTETSTNEEGTETPNSCAESICDETSNNGDETPETLIIETTHEKSLSDPRLQEIITRKCHIELREVKINLLRLPDKILLKVDYFRLSTEYFSKGHKKKAEKKLKKLLNKPKVVTRKRQREMENECKDLVKKLKSYDLEAFEEFCYKYYVGLGLCVPIPEKLSTNRKSVDNRSEMSYGCPVTPDSGRFSCTLQTDDSEFEHTDFDIEHESDHRQSLSRADSGCCVMSPPHEIDSALPFSSEPVLTTEDSTLLKLKEMFPNTFADPQRAELMKNLVRPPEKEAESEDYVQWKDFIDNKTAKDVEFNIHEYGTDILNTFPTKTKGEKISFESVVQDKSVGDVCRYFVSALQLANTYNVEICDERQGEVNAEGFNLKFLSNERQHEEMDELNLPLPSESQFIESLASTSSAHNRHSTPRHPTQNQTFHKAKRRRIDYT